MPVETKDETGLETVTFRIEGLSCSCEGQIVEKRVKSLKGVKSYSLNPITYRMKVTYDSATTSVQDIVTSVSKAGVRAVLQNPK